MPVPSRIWLASSRIRRSRHAGALWEVCSHEQPAINLAICFDHGLQREMPLGSAPIRVPDLHAPFAIVKQLDDYRCELSHFTWRGQELTAAEDFGKRLIRYPVTGKRIPMANGVTWPKLSV